MLFIFVVLNFKSLPTTDNRFTLNIRSHRAKESRVSCDIHAVNVCKLATFFANHIADLNICLSIYKCNVLYCP